MRGLPSIFFSQQVSLAFYLYFRNEFNKFNNTTALMLNSIYHMTLRLLKSHFCRKNIIILSQCYVRNVVMEVITFPENL